MNINQISQSRFLRKEDLPTPALVTIEADVYMDTIPGFDGEPDKEKAVIKFVEFEKPLTLNSTNLQLISQALGSDETTDWVGKQVVVYNDPSIAMKGKLVGGIRVRASKKPQTHTPKPVTVVGRNVAPTPVIADEDVPY